MGFPPYFWKKTRAAYNLSLRVEFIIDELKQHHKAFLSQRETSRVLGVSVNTLNQWEKMTVLCRHHATKKYSITELTKFLSAIQAKARPPQSQVDYLPQKYFLEIIETSKFEWPRKDKELTPKELAKRIGCHRSSIMRVINAYPSIAKRKTACRWVVLRKRWRMVFLGTIVEKK